MLNAFRGLLGSRSGAQSLTEHSMDMAPLGQVLVLSRPQAAITLKADAVAEMLHAQGDGRMRYAGVLLDFGGYGYRFSSADLGALLAAIAAWVRGWVAPCAIVLTSPRSPASSNCASSPRRMKPCSISGIISNDGPRQTVDIAGAEHRCRCRQCPTHLPTRYERASSGHGALLYPDLNALTVPAAGLNRWRHTHAVSFASR